MASKTRAQERREATARRKAAEAKASVDAPSNGEPIMVQPQPPEEGGGPPPFNGVVVHVQRQPDGNVSVQPQVAGDVQATEAVTILEMAVRAARQMIGLDQ